MGVKTKEMKREILFRGKMQCNDEWIHGFLSWSDANRGRNYFVNNNIVFNETVGQFTGMTDKNGTKIFEGDIVRHIDTTCHVVEVVNSEVYFDTEMLEFGFRYSNELFHCQFNNEFEVIGNIYDNKELLK